MIKSANTFAEKLAWALDSRPGSLVSGSPLHQWLHAQLELQEKRPWDRPDATRHGSGRYP